MKNYKSGKMKGFWLIMKHWLIGILTLLLLPLLEYVAPNFLPLKNTDWTFLLVFSSISYLIVISQYDWVNEIIIDTDKRSLLVRYYNIYEGKASKVFHFDKLKIRINKGALFNRSTISSISLFKGKTEEYEITRHKDGYSKESLMELATFLESLTRPVSK